MIRVTLSEYLLNRNTAPLEAAAVESFFAVTPAGIEPREHAVATVGNLDIAHAEVFTHRIEVIGNTAVLAGKIVMEGTIGGKPAPALGFLSVYTMLDGEWRLVARSLTPQLVRSTATSAGDRG